jgi:hypothetical protein
MKKLMLALVAAQALTIAVSMPALADVDLHPEVKPIAAPAVTLVVGPDANANAAPTVNASR